MDTPSSMSGQGYLASEWVCRLLHGGFRPRLPSLLCLDRRLALRNPRRQRLDQTDRSRHRRPADGLGHLAAALSESEGVQCLRGVGRLEPCRHHHDRLGAATQRVSQELCQSVIGVGDVGIAAVEMTNDVLERQQSGQPCSFALAGPSESKRQWLTPD